jgi:transcriptional regulator with XRE-family HTH domain
MKPRPPRRRVASPKAPPAGSTDGSETKRPERVPLLQSFGRLLREYREKLGRSQAQIARDIGSAQSLVAQIETGKLVNVSGDLLDKLAAAYEASRERLIAALIVDKYRVDPTRASLLNTHVLNLDGVAEWEHSLKAEELWIVTPSFVDRSHKGIRDAVVHLLRSGTRVVFFVPAHQCGEGGTFSAYRARLEVDLAPADIARLSHHELHKELRWVSSSFVIANAPSLFPAGTSAAKPMAEGYTIVLRDAEHPTTSPEAFAFRMSEDELWDRAHGIKYWLDDKAKNETRGERESAL